MADKTKELIECGKAFGYEGEDLVNYVESERARLEEERAKLEKKAMEDFERAERVAERELKKMELEREEREKKMEFEREEREKARAHELKLQELKKQRSLSPLSSKHSSRESLVSNENKLDMTILKLIPKFNEKEVTNFFMSFEKLVRRMACPSET